MGETEAQVDQPGLLTGALIFAAIRESVGKLHPRVQSRNPAMLVIYVGSILTTLMAIGAAFEASGVSGRPLFVIAIAAGLWLTLLFVNFAEALSDVHGNAMALRIQTMRRHVHAKRLLGRDRRQYRMVEAETLRRGDLVLVEANDIIPADGKVIDGVALVSESAVTGESAPVLRGAGAEKAFVIRGTRVLSDWLLVRVRCREGDGILDRINALVEGAERDRPTHKLSWFIFVAVSTIVFLLACATFAPFSALRGASTLWSALVPLATLIAFLVCLFPTATTALRYAIRIVGMDRMLRANVVASSGRAVEAAGAVDVLLLDKTGTVTLGDRHVTAFHAAPGIGQGELREVAKLTSLADATPEGRSIAAFAGQAVHEQGAEIAATEHTWHAFSANSRISGIDLEDRRLRKGAPDAVRRFVLGEHGSWPATVDDIVDNVARTGATPMVVADGPRVLGVIELRDIVKGGIRAHCAALSRMGIKTIMVTGDHFLTAAAIAAETGVDDFLSEATPEKKLDLIRKCQREDHVVAMCGDGINDAPALAQADVGIAMNTGTQAAKDAGNMVDLDSNPANLIGLIAIGKQMRATRGALTTFSIANGAAKYCATIPAVFITAYPSLQMLNFMQFTSAESAILSTLIFNALLIMALVPLALRGVRSRVGSKAMRLRLNLWISGAAGFLVQLAGIKLIDNFLTASRLV
jgi:K+-transporting ATPase ATPase B chain